MVAILTKSAAWLRRHLRRLHTTLRRFDWSSERGDIDTRVVATALMIGATIAIVGIIVGVLTGWANDLPTPSP